MYSVTAILPKSELVVHNQRLYRVHIDGFKLQGLLQQGYKIVGIFWDTHQYKEILHGELLIKYMYTIELVNDTSSFEFYMPYKWMLARLPTVEIRVNDPMRFVCRLQRFWRQYVYQKLVAKRLALAMAIHQRLGAMSCLHAIDRDILMTLL